MRIMGVLGLSLLLCEAWGAVSGGVVSTSQPRYGEIPFDVTATCQGSSTLEPTTGWVRLYWESPAQDQEAGDYTEYSTWEEQGEGGDAPGTWFILIENATHTYTTPGTFWLVVVVFDGTSTARDSVAFNAIGTITTVPRDLWQVRRVWIDLPYDFGARVAPKPSPIFRNRRWTIQTEGYDFGGLRGSVPIRPMDVKYGY